MKIVTKLKIFGTFAAVLVIILGSIIYWRANQVDLAIEKDRLAGKLVQDAFVLNVLNGDFIFTRGERARIQWMSQYTTLNKTINSYVIENEEERQIIDKLHSGQKATLSHFYQLQEIAEDGNQEISELEKRLLGQLSVDIQAVVSLASSLAEINTEKVTTARQTSSFFMFVVVAFLGFLLIFTYLLLAKDISASIRELIEGTKIFAGGNLSFRYKSKRRDEFGKLARAFNEMAENIQKTDEMKAEFISLVSHELRTPVGAIRGFMSMINNGDYGARNSKLERPLKLITNSVDRLLHIVNKMLDVSRIQSGKTIFNFTKFDIKETVGEVLTSLKPQASDKGIRLELKNKDSAIVYADREEVSKILNNLIDNAIKFTQKGRVTISWNKKSDSVVIIISDTGTGIPDEYQHRLFDKFDEAKLKQAGITSGIGLGLYISREYARKMGGDVWIESSTLGEGSIFGFSIPSLD